ncbi:ParB family protein [Cellvibrio sp. ARAG 10.3]|uniref:ParB family protein n=1 Tax=Cellvibrio sp. ARAG 10.3 TaxID=3451358 RepID=UPI003F4482B5
MSDENLKEKSMTSKRKAKTIDLSERLNRQARQAEVVTGDPAVATRVTVTIKELIAYDKNPRQTRNPKYEEIKESIRHRGLDHAPNITRRSPDEPYMIKDGGNTRLEILNELYQETGDEKFYRIDCMFHPWVDEEDAIAGHLVENDMRGGMLLIERALAAKTWKAMLDEKAGEPISLRQTAQLMTERGWKMDPGNLSVLFFAAETLLPLVPDALWAGAGNSVVKRLRSIEKSYKDYWESIESISTEQPKEPWQDIWSRTLAECDDTQFDFDSFRDLVDLRIGDALDVSFNTVRAEVDAILAGGKPSGIKPANPLYGRDRLSEANPGATQHLNSNTFEDEGGSTITAPSHGTTLTSGRTTDIDTSTHLGVDKNPSHISSQEKNPEALKTKSGKSSPTLESYRDQAYRAALELMTKLGLDPFIEKIDDGLGFLVMPVHNAQMLKGAHRRYYVYLVNLCVITSGNCVDPVAREKAQSYLPFSTDDYLRHVYHEHDPTIGGHTVEMMMKDLFLLQWMRSSPHAIGNRNHSEAILLSLISQIEFAIAGLRYLTNDDVSQLFQ